MIPECPRTRCHCGQAAAVPNQNQNQNRSVLLSEISTPIRTEPFTDRYDIIPGKELGRGKFAVVRKCVEKCSGREYAAKFLRKRRKGQDCRTEIIHEIAVLEMAKSSAWVVNLHQVYEMTSEMVLVLEFAAGGEIFNQCVGEAEEAFSEEEVKKLMRQILEGVAFLHRNNVVHLDLKPQNILLTSSDPVGDIKIVDFGLSRRVSKHQELREIMGTPEYVAPEILNYDPISTATDMWSIGVLAYVMLTGVSPFLGEDKQETFLNISTVNVSYADEELQRLDSNALRFIQSLLLRQPQERATAEQCLLHAWLQPKDQTSKTTEAELTERPPSAEPPQRPPGSQTPAREEEEEEPVTEELIVMATYALGQCRHTEQEGIMEGSDQKALVSKRFKFQEPFGALHDVIY